MLGLSRIIPESPKELNEWLKQLYDEIERLSADTPVTTFTQTITSTPTALERIADYGATLILINGVDSGLPAYSYSTVKSTTGSNGTSATIASQAGTGSWGGVTLTLTATSSGFDISHSGGASLSGLFKIIIITTNEA